MISVILSKITLEKEGFDPQKIGYQKKHKKVNNTTVEL